MHRDLKEWLRFTRTESHLLRLRPNLLFQLAANWREGSAPYHTARSRAETGNEQRPWLRRVNALKHWPLSLLTLSGHTDFVAACDFSPDGKLIASTSQDRSIGIWDSWSGERIRSIPGSHASSEEIRFLPDSRHVMGHSGSGRPTVWNALTGQVEAQVEDGSWLASSADATMVLLFSARYNAWKVRNPLLDLNRPADLAASERGNASDSPEEAVGYCSRTGAFARDGRHIVTVQEGCGAMVWDPVTRRSICEIAGITGERCSCALSPDGSLALVSEAHRLSIWDAEGGLQLGEAIPEGNAFRDCEFSPDGARILVDEVSEFGGSPRLYDSRDFRQIAVMKGHLEAVNALRFSPDSRLIATGAEDGTLRIWCSRTGEILGTLWGHTAKVVSLAFSPDSGRLVSASWDNTLKVWDLAEAQESRYGHVYSIGALAISPDGSWAGTGQEDGSVALTEITGKSETRIVGKHAAAAWKCKFSPDSRWFVSGSKDGTITAWPVAAGEPVTFAGHERAVGGLAFTPSGDTLVSCSWDGTIRLWNPRTGAERMVLRGHDHDINVVDISCDGRRLVSGSDDGTLRVWDLATGAALAILKGHEDDILDCKFSPDGSRILSTSRGLVVEGGYNAVKLWDTATGRELKNLEGHRDFGYRCAFSPDGCWMASGGSDKTCRLWDSEGNQVRALPGGTLYGFSPDGRWLSGGSEGDISIWSVPDGAEVTHYAAAAGKLTAHWLSDSRGIVLADDAGCIHVLRLENL
jgi:WD40 repeat protein